MRISITIATQMPSYSFNNCFKIPSQEDKRSTPKYFLTLEIHTDKWIFIANLGKTFLSKTCPVSRCLYNFSYFHRLHNHRTNYNQMQQKVSSSKENSDQPNTQTKVRKLRVLEIKVYLFNVPQKNKKNILLRFFVFTSAQEIFLSIEM